MSSCFFLLQKIDLALFQGHRSTHLRLNVKPRKENLWKKVFKKSAWKKHLIRQKVLFNSLSHKLQPILHIIDQNEHLKIFENHFYKYILKIAFSQKSKMKISFVCPSSFSWTINHLIQLSFFKNYFAYHSWWVISIYIDILTNHGGSIFTCSKFCPNTNSAQKFRPPWTEILRRRKMCISLFSHNNEID